MEATLVHDDVAKLWLIKDRGMVVGFVQKWKPRRGYKDPFKVFKAVCGQGPVHLGEMVAADYAAKNPVDAIQRNKGKL